jgi:hypothetical protein
MRQGEHTVAPFNGIRAAAAAAACSIAPSEEPPIMTLKST